jgi:arylsulfatase A-like enzyme
VAHGRRKDKAGAYKEMIEVMDEGIGRILNRLDMLDLINNTLVIFCSDNGGLGEVANNGILKGSKGSLWEGGHRVPAIAYWRNYIEPGTSTDEIIMSMDFFPTFVNLSKQETKHDFKFDGVDITRLLIEDKSLPDRSLFWKYRNQMVARNGEWKLLIDKDTSHLYNLNLDISEQVDLADTESSIVSQLKSELEEWEQDVIKGVKLKTK